MIVSIHAGFVAGFKPAVSCKSVACGLLIFPVTHHIYITGRLKDIIVLANGEKVPPSDMEMAITLDPLIDQIMVLGEGMPFLSAVAVLNPAAWQALAASLNLPVDDHGVNSKPVEEIILHNISARLHAFPRYAQIRRVTSTLEPWTVDNGLITPTMKTKRLKVLEKFHAETKCMYEGHC